MQFNLANFAKKEYHTSLILAAIRGTLVPLKIFLLTSIISSFELDSGGKAQVTAILLFVALLAAESLLGALDKRLSLKTRQKIELTMGESILEMLKDIPPHIIEKNNALQNKKAFVLDNYFSLTAAKFNAHKLLAAGIVTVIGLIYQLAKVSALSALILFAGSLLLALVFMQLKKKEVNTWAEAYTHLRYSKEISRIMTAKEFMPENHVFQSFDFLENYWQDSLEKFQSKVRDANLKTRIICGLLKVIEYALTIVLIYLLLIKKETAIAVITGFAIAAWQFIDVFSNSFYTLIDANKRFAILEKALNQLQKEQIKDADFSETPLLEDGLKSAEFKELRLENVSFTYSGSDQPAVDNVSLKIKKGDCIALVGENGSGKTTLIKLILRVLRPDQGNIYLNGVEADKIPYEQYYKIISAMFQSPARLELSLEELLAFGQNQNQETALSYLNEILDRKDFTADLSEGLQTVMGEVRTGAHNLSGGEWQALSLARVLASGEDFLIFDEPAASLDPFAEMRIYEMLLRKIKDKTSIFITHRLGSTKAADYILFMANGKIGEIGTHEQLLANGQKYKELYEEQKKHYV